jgi:thiol-disulfide isomerase/thioredoxin
VLYNTEGKSTDLKSVLDNYKGSIVLIDFWASWCKTCIREMEYSKKLQKNYKGKEVVFLFLSTDTDYKAWIRGLATINIEGKHYRIEKASKPAIKAFLKIRGIPYYVLLDTDGDIYDPKAKWPHQEKLKNSIDLLIRLNAL